jgi:hypothetical protein
MQHERLPVGKPPFTRRWVLLCIGVFAFVALSKAVLPTAPIASLHVGNNVYSNVTIREVADRSVTIAHARGMATLNLDKMTREERASVGVIDPEPEPPASAKLAARAGEIASSLRGLNLLGSFRDTSFSKTQAVEMVAQLETPEGAQAILNRLPPPRAMDFIGPVAAYLLLSMCFVVICAKAGKPAPFLAWVPIGQMFALYRAARMSPVWFVVVLLNAFLQLTMVGVALTKGLSQQTLSIFGWLFVTLLTIHLIGWIIWCFKICKARGKSPALGILLLIPGLNLIGLAYLTFSEGKRPAPLAKIAPTPEPAGLRLIL